MLILDFIEDWKEYVEKELIALGYQYNNNKSLEDNTLRYFNLKRILVSNKRRNIHESKELNIPLKYISN